MISLECRGRAPRLLYQQGIPECHRDAVLNRYFAAGYLLDPFCLAVENGLAEGFYHRKTSRRTTSSTATTTRPTT